MPNIITVFSRTTGEEITDYSLIVKNLKLDDKKVSSVCINVNDLVEVISQQDPFNRISLNKNRAFYFSPSYFISKISTNLKLGYQCYRFGTNLGTIRHSLFLQDPYSSLKMSVADYGERCQVLDKFNYFVNKLGSFKLSSDDGFSIEKGESLTTLTKDIFFSELKEVEFFKLLSYFNFNYYE